MSVSSSQLRYLVAGVDARGFLVAAAVATRRPRSPQRPRGAQSRGRGPCPPAPPPPETEAALVPVQATLF
ncbi:hypothetical protein [Mycobacterium tuberculosis]|uniref:hypothetical protein n=1 Tax=Mycobacterium tuberculosis TaxID=1773 RepID=UPI00031B86B0|nr:hypothetical protein [Mycobacterium tuberculosis]